MRRNAKPRAYRGTCAVLSILAACIGPAPPGAAAVESFQLVDTTGQSFYAGATTILDIPVSDLADRTPELQGLEPAPDQKELPAVLRRVGAQTESLSREMPNLVSREEVVREQLHKDGSVKRSMRQEFNYLILNHVKGHTVEMEEYRTDLRGRRIHPSGLEEGFSLTEGFATLWLNFHPSNQPTCRFRMLGEQTVDGRQTYVVAFAQKPGWGALAGTVRFNNQSYVILYQGIAWIDAQNFRIVRLRVDLLAPRPDIQLEQQTTVVRFGEVRIAQVGQPLWLPRQVTVTTRFQGRFFRNIHQYEDYRLFSVSSRILPGPPEESTPRKPD
jgi:hypothetical protein